MKKIAYLLLLTLSLYTTTVQAAYVIVPVTGFNQDVMVNGVGTSLSATTDDVDGVLWCWVVEGWQFSATSTPVTLGLPADGLITSPLTTGLSYQLQDYSENNSLKLTTATPGSLTLTSPMSAESLFILCSTGSGIASMGIQVNFSDGTNQVFPAVTVDDWHGGTPYEIGQTTRVQRNTINTPPENQLNGPRMYPKEFELSVANQTKTITSIQITRSAGPGLLNVYAVSAQIPDVCSGTPNAGTIEVAETEIPCNTSVALSLNGNTNLNGIHYQWQYNISGAWLNFGGNASALNSSLLFTDTWFRCVVTCSNGGGSSTTDSVQVLVTPLSVDLGNDTTLCTGSSLTLDAGYAGASYIWNNNSNNQTRTVSSPGTYNVIVTLSNGCSGRDTVVVTAGIMPDDILPAVTNLCAGDMATLNAGNSGSTFLWNTGATTQAITTDEPGNYQVSITSPDACTISSNTNLIIRPLPVVALGNDTAVCPGILVGLNAGPGTGNTYTWSNGSSTQVIQAADSGFYDVTVVTPYGCTGSDQLHIEHFPAPYVEGFNFIPMFYEDLGHLFFHPLNPVHVISFEWNFGDGSPVTTEAHPEHTYTSAGDYLVTLRVFNDCGVYTTSQPVHVDIATGVTNLHARTGIDLYPNPAQSFINIVVQEADVQLQGYTVYNMLGAVVQQADLANVANHQLQVGGLANGIYTIRLLSNKGWIVRKFELLQ